MASKQVFLASDSPRRKKLLAYILGNKFKVIRHLHNEDIDVKGPIKYVKANAYGKALEGSSRIRSGIVIGADTIVVCRGAILGKPGTKKKALNMLRYISGKPVLVISGVAVFDTKKKRLFYGHEKTVVKIKKLSDSEIRKYVGTGEPLDKAGAFAIQGKGSFLVEWIEGDYFNVVGLPISKLSSLLRSAGVRI